MTKYLHRIYRTSAFVCFDLKTKELNLKIGFWLHYPSLLDPKSEEEVAIWIRTFYGNKGRKIGNGTSYSLSSGYFFFHIGIHSDKKNIQTSEIVTLNCSVAVPCVIIVRKAWKYREFFNRYVYILWFLYSFRLIVADPKIYPFVLEKARHRL